MGINGHDHGSQASKQIFTTGEAAEICNVSQQTIIRCFDNGRLNGFRVPGSRFRRIPREDLIVFMKKNDIPLESIGQAGSTLLLIEADSMRATVAAQVIGELDSVDVHVANGAFDAGRIMERCKPSLVVIGSGAEDLDPAHVQRRLNEQQPESDARVMVFLDQNCNGVAQNLQKSGIKVCMEGALNSGPIVKELRELLGS